MDRITRILIVENDAITAADLYAHLLKLGYDVPMIVSTGKNAIRSAAELHPDLVLMDILLDGKMNGIEAAEAIRISYKIPVVFVTAHDDIQTITSAKVSAPYGYITKPYCMSNLKNAIETALCLEPATDNG